MLLLSESNDVELGEEMAVLLNFLLYDKLHFDDILRYGKGMERLRTG